MYHHPELPRDAQKGVSGRRPAVSCHGVLLVDATLVCMYVSRSRQWSGRL